MILRKAEFITYFTGQRDFYDKFLDFLDSENDVGANSKNLILYEISLKGNNRNNLIEFLQLMLKITNNHFRYPGFYSKIEQIITKLEHDIKQTFENQELFDFFKNNKLILLCLFEKKIIKINKKIIMQILQKNDSDEARYSYFFYPEITSQVGEENRKEIDEKILKIYIFTNYTEKRKEGQNDTEICQIIRADAIEDFITYTTQHQVPLTSQIEPSFYETNSFLLKNSETKLIEYTAFFGSIKIFKYLLANEVPLTPSIWLYSIHSKNLELIQILEKIQVIPDEQTIEKCFEEAIKCHHNEIANYIHDHFINKEIEQENLKQNYFQNTLAYGFHYHNFNFLPNEFNDDKFIFFYACEFNYINIVEILLKNKNLNIDESIISNKKIF